MPKEGCPWIETLGPWPFNFHPDRITGCGGVIGQPHLTEGYGMQRAIHWVPHCHPCWCDRVCLHHFPEQHASRGRWTFGWSLLSLESGQIMRDWRQFTVHHCGGKTAGNYFWLTHREWTLWEDKFSSDLFLIIDHLIEISGADTGHVKLLHKRQQMISGAREVADDIWSTWGSRWYLEHVR